MKIVSKVRVKNPSGIHTRPATRIVQILQQSKSEAFFTHKRETASGRSLLHLLMLGMHKNRNVIITVDGEDAEDTMNKLVHAFETKFGEEY